MDGHPLTIGSHRGERADAARNRQRLLDTAREMIADIGVDKVTMDGLAERSGLGKGTVYRRFRSRAGIFLALLDDDEHALQQRVLSGPPPLGPGAGPVDRLIAYGRARIVFLLDHHAIARAAMDRANPIPAGHAALSQFHIRMLLGQAGLDVDDLQSLAVQLTAALEGPVLLYLSAPDEGQTADLSGRLTDSWQVLIEHVTAKR